MMEGNYDGKENKWFNCDYDDDVESEDNIDGVDDSNNDENGDKSGDIF